MRLRHFWLKWLWNGLLVMGLMSFGVDATSARPTPIASADVVSPSTLYLPLIVRNYPLTTIFGIHADNGVNQVRVAEAGGTWLRGIRLLWKDVEPQPGIRDWASQSNIDNLLSQASVQSLTPLLMVSHTPAWAQEVSGYECGPLKADALAQFGQFMHDLVARYSAPPYNVRYYEIWNEPDVDPSITNPVGSIGCWGDNADEYYGGGRFADMLKAIYPRMKEADPQAQLYIGGQLSYCNPNVVGGCAAINPPGAKPYNFFEGILRHNGQNDGGQYFDGLNFTAYDYYESELGHYGANTWGGAWNTTGPVMSLKTQFFRDVMARYNVAGKSLMATEVALVCASQSCDSDFELSKTYYVAQVYATSLKAGIKASLWYSLEGWRQSGLLDTNSQPNQTFMAYQFAAQQLTGASFARDVVDYHGVRAIELNGRTDRLWVLWSLDGNAHGINLPSQPTSRFGITGTVLSLSQAITVTLEPQYIHWGH